MDKLQLLAQYIGNGYYQVFIKDWDLAEPNGEPPAEAIDIERSIRIND